MNLKNVWLIALLKKHKDMSTGGINVTVMERFALDF